MITKDIVREAIMFILVVVVFCWRMLKFVKSFQCDSFFQVNEKQKRHSFAYLTIKKCPWHFLHEESCAFALSVFLTRSGAYEQEHATPLYFCHGVFKDRFIFRSNLLWMRLPWECHNQSQNTNWRYSVTEPELAFFHKRKGVLKIDQSVKMPWNRLSMESASSCSSAPDKV